MNIESLRKQLRSGEWYRLPKRPAARSFDPFVIYANEIVNIKFTDNVETNIELVDGEIVFDRTRRADLVTIEVGLQVGRLIGSVWRQDAVRLDVRRPEQRIFAQALEWKPIWTPGVIGESEPSSADGPCYRITAEVTGIEYKTR